MEKRGKFSSTQLTSTLSPRWKSGGPYLKYSLSPNELANSRANISSRKTELEKYKSKLNQKCKQSPIVKACKNVEGFYRSIKPLKSKFSTFQSIDQGARGKIDLLMSFYLQECQEDMILMSQVVNLESLERLKDLTNEFYVQQEDEM